MSFSSLGVIFSAIAPPCQMKSKVRISYPAIPAFDAKGNNSLQIADQ